MQKKKWGVYGPEKHRRKWRIRVTSPDGETRCRSFETKAEAAEYRVAVEETLARDNAHTRAAELYAEAEAALAEAESRGLGRRTVKEAMEAYEVARRGKVKRVSLDRERYQQQALLRPLLAMPVAKVSARRASERYQERTRDPISPATHRGELIAARALWRWLLKERWVIANPWADVEPIGVVPRGKEQLRSQELVLVRNHALGVAQRPGQRRHDVNRRLGGLAVLVTLYLGLRTIEVVRLQGRDVGERQLTYRKAKRRFGQTELNTVYVPEDLDTLLHMRVAELSTPTDLLFPRRPGFVCDWVKRLCATVKVPEITAQGMRGTHASVAVENGATARAVAKQLGHGQDIGVTRRHYIQSNGEQSSRVERVEEQLDRNGSKKSETPEEIEREIARLQTKLEQSAEPDSGAKKVGRESANFLDPTDEEKSPE